MVEVGLRPGLGPVVAVGPRLDLVVPKVEVADLGVEVLPLLR